MDTAYWTIVGISVTVALGLGGVLVRVVDRLNKAEAKADAAGDTARAATLAIAGNKIEIDRLDTALVEHRVAAAKEYASKGNLEHLEGKIVEAINRLGDRLDKMLASHR
jgi:NACalpha-BTF3-like transcription factor